MKLEIDRPKSTNVGNATRRAMDNYIRDGLSAGFALSQNRVPEDRGQLRRSGFPPEKRSDGSFVTGYTAPYAEAQEKGTPPGHTPPLRPLLEWGDRVFNPDVSADTIMEEVREEGIHDGIFRHPGAAIWSKIRANGIKPKGFLSDGASEAKAWFRRNDPDRYLEREL